MVQPVSWGLFCFGGGTRPFLFGRGGGLNGNHAKKHNVPSFMPDTSPLPPLLPFSLIPSPSCECGEPFERSDPFESSLRNVEGQVPLHCAASTGSEAGIVGGLRVVVGLGSRHLWRFVFQVVHPLLFDVH